jgi:hypothetical protein
MAHAARSKNTAIRSTIQPGEVRPRPRGKISQAHGGVSPLNPVSHRNVTFQQMPRPLGLPPYHYELADTFVSKNRARGCWRRMVTHEFSAQSRSRRCVGFCEPSISPRSAAPAFSFRIPRHILELLSLIKHSIVSRIDNDSACKFLFNLYLTVWQQRSDDDMASSCYCGIKRTITNKLDRLSKAR